MSLTCHRSAAGARPTDPSDLLKLTILQTNGVTMRFTAQSNLAYTVEFQTTPTTHPWQSFRAVLATNQTRVLEVADPDLGGETGVGKLFRVRTTKH